VQKLLKEIKSDVQTFIGEGEEPQSVYEQVCEKYCIHEKDKRFLQKFIAEKVKHTVTPQNRKAFKFSYNLYLISLGIVFFVTLISKQHRIEALGIYSLSAVSLWGGYVIFNLFAWIYCYLAVRSWRFNLSVSRTAFFIAAVDVVRLLILFPVYWVETPVFSILRLLSPLLVIICSVYYLLKCRNHIHNQ